MTDQPTLALAEAPASHPHLLITLPATKPAHRGIFDRYHVSFNLPDSIFVDRHELIDLWGQGGRVEWELTPEEIDIERPVSNTTEYSTLRVGWVDGELDIPLHVRYLEPNNKGSEVVNLFLKDKVKAGWGCRGMKGELEGIVSQLTTRHRLPLYCAPRTTRYHLAHWTRIRPPTRRARYAGSHLARVDLLGHKDLGAKQTESAHQEGLIASAYHPHGHPVHLVQLAIAAVFAQHIAPPVRGYKAASLFEQSTTHASPSNGPLIVPSSDSSTLSKIANRSCQFRNDAFTVRYCVPYLAQSHSIPIYFLPAGSY
jgi:hypothetical protein